MGDDREKYTCWAVRNAAPLLPVLHRINRESESVGELRLIQLQPGTDFPNIDSRNDVDFYDRLIAPHRRQSLSCALKNFLTNRWTLPHLNYSFRYSRRICLIMVFSSAFSFSVKSSLRPFL
jgi:hypothetical protein